MTTGPKNHTKEKGPDHLRGEAEKKLAAQPVPVLSSHPDKNPKNLLHELQVHQIELEMQNEALREAQHEIEVSRDRYLDLYEFAPVGYLTLTGTAILTEANFTAASMLGIERSRLFGTRFRKYVAPEDLETWDRYFIAVLKGAGKQAPDLKLRREDGAVFHARLESSLGEAKVPLVRVAITDVTAQKKSEENLRLANTKLNLLFSITRHDIRNQITTLNGYLGLSRESLGDAEKMSDYIAKEERAVDAIGRQIAFTKEYQEIGVEAPAWQSISACIKKAIAALNMRGIRVSAKVGGLELYADPLLEKVFYNLIDNALRYGGEAMSVIRISSRDVGKGIIVEVNDDGAGITPEDKERLFERGFGKNMGLGLALSREILALTGIAIRETSAPGEGARFEIAVPEGAWRKSMSGEAGS